jgi:hypothetical protein
MASALPHPLYKYFYINNNKNRENRGDILADVTKPSLDGISNSEDPVFLISVFRTGTETERSAAADRFVTLPVSKFMYLLQGLQDRDGNVRRWSAISIGRTQDSFFVPQLVDLLKDGVEAVSETAFDVLKDMVPSNRLLEAISAEARRENSTEKRRQLESYLARTRTEYLMVHAGVGKKERARLLADSHALIVRMTRRGPRTSKAPMPQPAPARKTVTAN